MIWEGVKEETTYKSYRLHDLHAKRVFNADYARKIETLWRNSYFDGWTSMCAYKDVTACCLRRNRPFLPWSCAWYRMVTFVKVNPYPFVREKDDSFMKIASSICPCLPRDSICSRRDLWFPAIYSTRFRDIVTFEGLIAITRGKVVIICALVVFSSRSNEHRGRRLSIIRSLGVHVKYVY